MRYGGGSGFVKATARFGLGDKKVDIQARNLIDSKKGVLEYLLGTRSVMRIYYPDLVSVQINLTSMLYPRSRV